jgi:hypothetical protein
MEDTGPRLFFFVCFVCFCVSCFNLEALLA